MSFITVYLILGIIVYVINAKKILKDFDRAECAYRNYVKQLEKKYETYEPIVKDSTCKKIAKAAVFSFGIQIILFWPVTIVYEYNIKPLR